MFFAENYYGVDDGILASCKVIELAARSRSRCRGCSTRCRTWRPPPSSRQCVRNAEKFRVIAELTQELQAPLRRHRHRRGPGALSGRGLGARARV